MDVYSLSMKALLANESDFVVSTTSSFTGASTTCASGSS